ncbi:MAG: DUF401 family protein [Bacillota bacterium]
MELAGLFISMILIVYVVTRWGNVAAALTAGILVVTLFSSISPRDFLGIVYHTTMAASTIELIVIVLLITLFSSVMYNTHILEKLINSLITMMRSVHVLLALLPAIVGLLAIPGGAIMSCPFVDKLGDKIKMPPGFKSGTNIFFRHLSVFLNPLSPLLIIAADISGLGFLPIIKFHVIPVTLSLIVGLVVLHKFWPEMKLSQAPYGAKSLLEHSFFAAIKEFLVYGSPLIIALILKLGFGINFIISLSLAIILTVVIDARTEKVIRLCDAKKIILQDTSWQLGLAVYTITLFGAFVNSSGAVPMFADIIINAHMPLIVLLVFTSVLIGFAAGHPIVGSAIIYPIFVPLVGPGAEGVAYLSVILTGMMFGYVVSPIHLCLIVTNEYFKVGYRESYPLLLPLQTLLLITAVALALLMKL